MFLAALVIIDLMMLCCVSALALPLCNAHVLVFFPDPDESKKGELVQEGKPVNFPSQTHQPTRLLLQVGSIISQ